ncbi:hypothetical protein TNCV_3430061 [Trichonephila clavipes]|nr:hypothetical protein TNCV_3430061 [Trichonephila clavipes]
MATGSYLTPNYSRSQSEIQGDLHKMTDIKIVDNGLFEEIGRLNVYLNYNKLKQLENQHAEIDKSWEIFGWIRVIFVVKKTASVFAALKAILYLENQSSKSKKCLLRAVAMSCGSVWVAKIAVSSANMYKIVLS